MTETPETPSAPEPTGPSGAEPPAPPPPAPPPPAPPAAAGYPVRLDVERQTEYNRFLPFVKWLLAIPHYIVLYFLQIAAAVVVFISAFAVLFTGRYPPGMFDFVVGVYRWHVRVGAYVFLMADQYPPFTLTDDPNYPYPVDFGIDYPEQGVNRWRPFVQWLLIIPYGIVAALIAALGEIIAFAAAFVILFTKRFPEGMFEIVLIAFRWSARASAYAHFVVTRYPPWIWA